MKRMNIKIDLPVSILKEGDVFVAYTPALDLSTYGNTLEETKNNFVEAVMLFFEELQETGTTNEVLTELGWQKRGSEYMPPVVVSHQTESFSIPLAS